MSELIQYRNNVVQLGTCESLYYTSFEKYKAAYQNSLLKGLIGNLPPSGYLKIKYGFLYRFPFPDEDKLPFCHIIESFYRSIPITLSKAAFNTIMEVNYEQDAYRIGIEFQKLVDLESDKKLSLVMVFREYGSGQLYRMEGAQEVKILIGEIIKNHITNEPNLEKKNFYRRIGARILKGYRLKITEQELKQGYNTKTGIADLSDQADPRHVLSQAKSEKANQKPVHLKSSIRR